jgi:hypothetical protein
MSGLVCLLNSFQVVLMIKLLRLFGYVDYIRKVNKIKILRSSPSSRIFSLRKIDKHLTLAFHMNRLIAHMTMLNGDFKI